MLTTERVSQLQDVALNGNVADKNIHQSLSREEQAIVNGLQNQIMKYAEGLSKLINEHK